MVVLPALGIVGGLISGTLVARLAPAAGGSGISHLVGTCMTDQSMNLSRYCQISLGRYSDCRIPVR